VLNSRGLRAFSVLGPRLWNSLPRLLRDTSHNTTSFGHSLKTFFLSQSTSAYGALGALAIMRYTNLRFTYLLVHSSPRPLLWPRRHSVVTELAPTSARPLTPRASWSDEVVCPVWPLRRPSSSLGTPALTAADHPRRWCSSSPVGIEAAGRRAIGWSRCLYQLQPV